MTIRIEAVGSASGIEEAGRLFAEYAAGLPFSLEYQGFSAELRGLPGVYSPPRGAILIAWEGGSAAGVVAVRPMAEAGACEMKRLYVRPAWRGRGVGRALVEGIVSAARGMGYGVMRLDTSAEMSAARATYERAGFRECARYNDDPDPTTVYYSLDLRRG
ncbi:MAG: GNAT family N-acetyltransferase [Phycisphaeraceae bacterium]|nr:MAG: GNAT family N-acetyltransferase [Phycisphaeraceae bacterium]